MKMTCGAGSAGISCRLSTAPNLYIEGHLSQRVERDTLCYAVCRFFSRNEALCRSYAWESYRLRLAKGKARRSKRHLCTLPAPLLELPAGWVQVSFLVDATGVTLQRLSLSIGFPAL